MEPDIDKIEAYLSGALAGAERQAFEAEIAGDPALAEEVDAVRLAREAVEFSISSNLRAQFQEWQEAEATGTKTEEARVVTMAPRRNLRRVLAIAASVLLILAVGSFWYANEQFASDQLAMDYYENMPLDLHIRGNAEELPEAVAKIRDNNFAEADAYLRSVPADDPLYYNARYYLAHSLHRQGEYDASNDILNEVNEASNPNLREDASWLKVLNYLELEQTGNDEFQTLLEEMIADDGHTHHNDAVNLNDKLNSFWYNIAN
ncbi:anti-sigma factor [Flavilitoribacter nigricans]|uniref:Tetratricopeptide repeat protein n=1 Tax=Flavilitoribacter nigricans (strain ATCC 23147 / DSM 23189 / NBRC 102662 / NCIMB 1420 / SS-2) TaxID=1122177 RepID=A0A2D0N796_FLAN2|nr:hypothetical protein [Flavilitoribacter nigricans]PHN03999.1 hypothetical protein CRP01_24325 [Flavilitoribacter nigricans DSM 23189 = NBRC 102662]